jgi:hypothetical protein
LAIPVTVRYALIGTPKGILAGIPILVFVEKRLFLGKVGSVHPKHGVPTMVLELISFHNILLQLPLVNGA